MKEESSLPVSVSTDRGKNKVWMVKLPKPLAESWKQTKTGDSLGSLTITNQNGEGKGVQVQIHSEHSQGAADYSVDLQPLQNPQTHIFSETGHGEMAWEGCVGRLGSMQPNLDERYRQMCKSRLEQSQARGRVTQVTDEDSVQLGKVTILEFAGLKKRRVQGGKAKHVEKDELIGLVFEAFNKRSHWDLRGLRAELGQQPVVAIKSVLSDLCIYNRRGRHRSQYELKPEFKKRSVDDATAAAASDDSYY